MAKANTKAELAATWEARMATTAGQAAILLGAEKEASGADIAAVVHTYILADFMPEDAERVAMTVRARATADNPGIVLPVRPQAVSDLRSSLKAREWTCCNALFEILKAKRANFSSLAAVTQWVRANVAKDGPCPDVATVEKIIADRKAKQNGKGDTVRPVNPVTAVAGFIETGTKLVPLFAGTDGAAFLTALLNAAEALKPFADKVKAGQDEAKKLLAADPNLADTVAKMQAELERLRAATAGTPAPAALIAAAAAPAPAPDMAAMVAEAVAAQMAALAAANTPAPKGKARNGRASK